MTMKQTADMEYIPHLQLKIRLITGLGIVTLLLSMSFSCPITMQCVR